MKIKMLTSIAGADFCLSPGDETERFSADEIKRLIEAGYAELVSEQKIDRAIARQYGKEKRAAPDAD